MTTDIAVTARIDAVRVWGSPHQLAQALRNLVDNAIRHASGSITLILRAEDDHAIIRIADDGPGIPPEQRERVFDRFVRLDESRDRARGGTGLGLAIVREIVRAHGGSVAVADTAVGATLEVVLPLSSPTEERTPPLSGVDRSAHQRRSANR
jgi:signal transduction histidine kinase